MNDKAPQVFLSYAHESDEFRQTVRELAEYLRGQGSIGKKKVML